MPYVVRKTDGSVFLVLQDGLVDASTSLYLVGRSFTGYGEFIADNFVRLLENFASDTPPLNPIQGQMYYNTVDKKYYYWDNTGWDQFGDAGPIGYTGSRGIIGATGATGPVGDTGPSGPRGYTGSQGEPGPTGDLGPTGGLGYTGSRGFTGSQGDPGPIGATGYTGSRGTIGPQGDIGYTGSRGPTGPIGPDGLRGIQGFTGSQGASGPPGAGLSGNLNIVGQTINGTVTNGSITISPLGNGTVITTGKLIPTSNNMISLGDTTNFWTNIYTGTVRFPDGTAFSSATRLVGATPPTSSIGSFGDIAGKIAFDVNYLYYCFATYNAVTHIWKRMPWDPGTW